VSSDKRVPGDVVELRDVTRTFGDVVAVDHVTLGIRQGEFFALLGPSGCGKTTTLRILAGFERPTSGDVYLRGRRVNDVPPYRRETNLVFQQLALFPHMDVYDNVAFGLHVKRRPAAETSERVRRVLELVELTGFERRRMHEISGGQQQRVAIARALVNEPAVLLLDEPLGSLDLKLRVQMQRELKAMQRRSGATFVYVTHDQGEALAMADRIAVMQSGRIAQVGSPEHIYTRPATRFVAHFIGDTNIIPVTVGERDASGILTLEAKGGVRFPAADPEMRTGETRNVSLRPEKIHIGAPHAARPNGHPGKVLDVTFLGPLTRYEVTVGEDLRLVVQAQTESEEHFRKDDAVSLSWPPSALVVLKD
jgi:spermidine/putrescine transport system ATP-binding protein